MFFDFHYMNKDDEEKQLQRVYEYQSGFFTKLSLLADITSEVLATPSEDILEMLFKHGTVGFAMLDGALVAGTGGYFGKLDVNGRGEMYRMTLKNGTVVEGKAGVDIVVMYLNTYRSGYLPMVERYSTMLAETDLSMVYNIRYTRVCPIPVVHTDNERRSMETVIKNLFNGVTQIFKNSTDARQMFTGQTQNEVLDLTTPQASEYMQNLSRFHDELVIRACMEFGIHVSARDKGAQLNEKELNAFEDYCIIGGEMLKLALERLKADIEKVFMITVKAELRKFVCDETHAEGGEQNENGIQDDSRDMEQ